MTTELAAAFPPGFTWGVAASAYQTEGAVAVDGRGPTIWDRFCALPGKVRNGESGSIACDFYNRYPEDIELLAALGVDAFRFSIAWSRVVPEGRGRVSAAGLDFYDRLVDALLAAGIEPFATLYHFDLPQRLEDEGGWPVRSTAEAFADYAEAVAARLGDRVGHWITHNEPWVSAWLGYGTGEHAPGRTSRHDALASAHQLLRSHGLAVEVLRRDCPGAEVGITLDLYPTHAASESPADRAAARLEDGTRNRWFLDPLLRGSYPDDVAAYFAQDLPELRDGDLETIAAPLDFLGINNYSRTVVRAGAGGDPVPVRVEHAEHTDMGWEIYPDGIREALERVHREYAAPPLYVTENGAAFPDVRGHDGHVRDPERQRFLERYLGAVAGAVAAGVPVRGYFVWSLLDNFEWSFGYWRRFGLVYVDYPTLERAPKESFGWYRDTIAASRAGHTLDRLAS